MRPPSKLDLRPEQHDHNRTRQPAKSNLKSYLHQHEVDEVEALNSIEDNRPTSPTQVSSVNEAYDIYAS